MTNHSVIGTPGVTIDGANNLLIIGASPYSTVWSVLRCPPGYYKPVDYTVTTCTQCVPGRYAQLDGATTCDECAMGYYSAVAGATVPCQSCTFGAYTTTTGATSCLCNPGFEGDGATCSECNAGSYAANAGTTGCDPCGTGTYQEFTGRTLCNDCPLHGTSSTMGSSLIGDCYCYAGYEMASTSCEQCGTGSYKAVDDSSPCLLCDDGSYAATTGATGCTQCTANSNTFIHGPGSTSADDCICAEGYEGLGGSPCTQCSIGVSDRQIFTFGRCHFRVTMLRLRGGYHHAHWCDLGARLYLRRWIWRRCQQLLHGLL